MLLFDSHLDLGFNGVDWNRDLRMAVAEIRVQEITHNMTDPGRRTNTVSFPELKKAQIGVGVATVLARQERQINHPFGCTTPEACYAVAMSHLYYYRAMERAGWMRSIKTKRELQQHVADWTADPAATPFGYILSMECGDPVLEPDNIREWYEMGLRAIGITHYGPNRYAGGTQCEVGLAVDALPLLRNIEELGIALDTTHLSDKAFWQVADQFGGKVLASHQNARKFADWQRQFSDEQIKHVISRGDAATRLGARPEQARGDDRPRGREHRPHLPARGQLPARGCGERPGRRLRHRAGAGRPGHDRGPAAHPGAAGEARVQDGRRGSRDARQLAALLRGRATKLTRRVTS